MGEYTVRTMIGAEFIAIDWAAAGGWNPGLHDDVCFHAANANGFLIGLLDNVPVATISALRYDGGYGFIGFYIVEPGRAVRGTASRSETWR